MVRHRILITGVTGGTGLALAKKYIKENHIVIGCGRNERVIADLKAKYSAGGHIFKVVDIMKKKEVSLFAKEVIESIGAPTFLLNIAGVCYAPQSLVEMSTECFDNVIDINIKGTFYITHSFLPSMIAAGKGIIVNFSSSWGRDASVNQSAYCCSKFGVEGFSKALALDLPPPLACIPLNPGVINTPMLVIASNEEFARTNRSPDTWAEDVGDYILKLDRNSNGKSLTAPKSS